MIEFKDVAVFREGRLLFQNVNIQLHTGQKIGLTGNNGTGKSTLFATLLGQHPTEAGVIDMPASWQIAHMAQEVFASEQTALDYVLSGDDEWYTLNHQIHHPTGLSELEIAKLHQRFDEIDGYRTPAKALQILAGLGFSATEHQNAVSYFSGGWRMRLNLARTLMKRADVLLLDEPTNHLDLDMRNALMMALGAYQGALILVSHDRDLITTVCDQLLLVSQGRVQEFAGDMNDYATHLKEVRLAKHQNQKIDKPTHETISKEDKRKLSAQNRQKTAPLRKEIEKLEKELEKYYQTLKHIDEQLSDNTLYEESNKEKLLQLLNTQSQTQKNTENLEETLLLKMDELETLSAQLQESP